MKKDFIIDQVSWHTQVRRNYEYDTALNKLIFRNIIYYLQQNHLTTRVILFESDEVKEDTCIKASDLTDEGFLFVKKCYDKWTEDVEDKIILPNDYQILDNALKKIRSSRK